MKLPTLKEVLYKKYNIPITQDKIKRFIQYCNIFELRKDNPMAFNSNTIGVYKAYFSTVDYNMLFDIFNIDVNEFKDLVLHTEHLMQVKRQVKNSERSVFADPYNILTIWLCHCTTKSKLPQKVTYQFRFTLLKLLYFKFFTTNINHMFQYNANQQLMEQTINSLSYKYDIKNPKTPTWKLVIEDKVHELLSNKSIHYKTLLSFMDDKAIVYIITDMATRLKVKLRSIVSEFYKIKEESKHIRNSNLVGEIDGKKVLKDFAATYDILIKNVSSSVLNINEFIDYDNIHTVCGLTKNINHTLLRNLLTIFSNLAVMQYKAQKQDLITGENESTIYEGYNVLISYIIQKTYRFCAMDRTVNMKSKLAILKKASDTYRSSRINDPYIKIIKNSIDSILEKNMHIKRESTLSALKIGFIQYIIILSFKHM